MLSIVVPAAWGHEPFCDFLSNVVELPVIGEVILINNNVEKTPDHSVLSHPKVNVLNQEQNIYVNPAWNLGVSLAKYENICILSDDVIVDLKAFIVANKFMCSDVSENMGVLMIGIKPDVYKLHNEQFESLTTQNLIIDGNIKIVSWRDNPDTFGSGSLFFIHKRKWIDIPNEFKVYWGDTWQYEIQLGLRKENYYINNCFYYSPWSAAVKIGVGAGYQQTDDYKKYENREFLEEMKKIKFKEIESGEQHGR
jgi:hypothetical protein